jgi:hypothetical protein
VDIIINGHTVRDNPLMTALQLENAIHNNIDVKVGVNTGSRSYTQYTLGSLCGKGLSCSVYRVIECDCLVIKIARSIRQCISSLKKEHETYSQICELVTGTEFRIPRIFATHETYAVILREHASGCTLTRYLLKQNIIRYIGNGIFSYDRASVNVLPVNIYNSLERLIRLRWSNPTILRDIGPDNVIIDWHEDGLLIWLVDQGTLSVETRIQFDGVENVSNYLSVAAKLISRYYHTNCLS